MFKDKPVVCGIYTIFNTENKFVYVGQSIDIWRRWGQHISSLDKDFILNHSLQIGLKHGRNKLGFT